MKIEPTFKRVKCDACNGCGLIDTTPQERQVIAKGFHPVAGRIYVRACPVCGGCGVVEKVGV